MTRTTLAFAVMLAGMTLSSHAGAAGFDRNQRPEAGPTPPVSTPKIARATLRNGLPVWVVTRRGLPVVDVLIQIRAGSAQDGAKPGLAAMTASLMDEGTAKHSALEFAEAVSYLGASLVAMSGFEQTTVSLLTLTKHLDESLGLLGEMVTTPAFKAEEIERERTSRLQSLKQQRDVASLTADKVFNIVSQGADHPYGHPSSGTPETIAALTREDIAGFYGDFYRPNNAVAIVVGDVSVDEIVPKLEAALGGWTAKPIPAGSRDVPAKAAAKPLAVYLVDKPNAAQSEIRIGQPGAPRTATADYYALQILNTALGGQFTSRINLNLRERHGYTYGARSSFAFRRGPGPFVASAGVFTAKTDSALVEFMKELKDVRGARPLTADEIAFSRNALQRGYPRRFETADGVADILADLALYELPESEISNFPVQIGKVKPEDATRVAKEYLSPEHLAVVVVGDLAKIRPGIEKLNLGPITVLDADGKPVSTQ
jgi:zinc protease